MVPQQHWKIGETMRAMTRKTALVDQSVSASESRCCQGASKKAVVIKSALWGAWVAQSVKRPTSARSRSRGP